MKTIHIFTLFIIVALIQLFVPAQVILKQESVLETGHAYKFKTQPIDPNDPFRGKYITLNYAISSIKTKDSLWKRNEPLFVYLKIDSLGYAKIDTVSRQQILKKDNDYCMAKVRWYSKYDNTLNIDFAFKRYYMEETKAYDAEVAVRIRQRDSLLDNTHALVYVKEGEAVLSDVIIDNISIKNYVE